MERHMYALSRPARQLAPTFQARIGLLEFSPAQMIYIIHAGVWERCQRVRRLKKCKSGLFTGRETHSFFSFLLGVGERGLVVHQNLACLSGCDARVATLIKEMSTPMYFLSYLLEKNAGFNYSSASINYGHFLSSTLHTNTCLTIHSKSRFVA